jgi:D-sedoheptulose 7-phosphate isomerase
MNRLDQTHMKNEILYSVRQAALAIEQLQKPEALRFIEETAYLIADAYANQKKILIAGNGGSLCDAMHFAEELTGFYREKRKALPAIALADPGHITCVGNDIGYEYVFSRAVEALGQTGDVLIVLTTSGQSMNLIQAVESAKTKGLKTVAFLGKTGGKLKGLADLEWIVEGFKTSDRIQEVHMSAIHIIIEIIEKILFSANSVQLETTLASH